MKKAGEKNGVIYAAIKNVAVYLVLVTVLSELVIGKSYKKYVRLVCGMVLILVVLLPVTNLLALEDTVWYNFNLSSFKVQMLDTGILEEAEETQREKLQEEYIGILEERIRTIAGREGRSVKKTDIVLAKDDYGIVEELTVEIAAKEQEEEKAIFTQAQIEKVQIEKIVIAGEKKTTEGEKYLEKNKTTEKIRKELASEFAMKEESVNVYEMKE